MKLALAIGAACGLLFAAAGVYVLSGSEHSQPLELLTTDRSGVALRITPPPGGPGDYDLTLFGPGPQKLASLYGKHSGSPLEVRLAASIEPGKEMLYAIQWSINGSPAERRSLYFLKPILETVLIAPREYLAGSSAALRVVVHDRAAGSPIAGAVVKVRLDAGGQKNEILDATTDANGNADGRFRISPDWVGMGHLIVTVSYAGQTDAIDEVITVTSSVKTMLTTDKPLYQPGQTVHIRSLTLRRPDLAPASSEPAVIEVEDSKGNKVFKEETTTDRFGVAFADFVLADEVNLGPYKVTATMAGAREEKTVTVDRYVLPKFRINFDTDRKFYAPGDTVSIDLQADYFFGKPVAGADVEITAQKFDVAYETFSTVKGKTDQAGHYTAQIRLPEYFVGQPLLEGKAAAKFDVALIDTADHKEQITRNVMVTSSPLLVLVVPESGSLIPGLPNRVYLVATYADGTAAQCNILWSIGGKTESSVRTDAGGFAQIEFVPEESASTKIKVAARDDKGNQSQAEVDLSAKNLAETDRVLLRADRALYKAGDSASLQVFSTMKKGTVFIDLIRDKQTYLTAARELMDGKASLEIGLDPSLAGTLTASAYIISSDGNIVRDQRVIVVDPASDLKVELIPGADTYLPGTEATLQVRVTNPKGEGTAASLGISIVDEAVFALQEMRPGLEKVYFYLEQEIAKPRYEIHGWEARDLVISRPGEPEILRDKAARVLLAGAKEKPEGMIEVNTYLQRQKGTEYERVAAELLADNYRAVQKAMEKAAKDLKLPGAQLKEGYGVDYLVQKRYLAKEDLLDPWGNPLKMADAQWCDSCQLYHQFRLVSAGPDAKEGTVDDVSFPPLYSLGITMRGGGVLMERLEMGAPMEVDFKREAVAAKAVMAPAEAAPAAGVPEPRIRTYFPETLFWMPSLITDESGRATLTVPLADSITTWRMTALANSLRGELGSTASGLRVFQDFFVDIDFPVALTQNDRVWVPVAVYNYLKEKQTVRLVVEDADWFDLDGPREKEVELAADEVKGVKFPIKVKGIGWQRFTVKAYGTKASDAIARTVEVVPDGIEVLTIDNGRLEGIIESTITIPKDSIPGAGKIFVKVYPGVISQLVEGLDSMLRMPFGCFEQTSSVTYPNILVLDYMKATRSITPEIQMKAEGFVNAGYQRLLSFEVPGGGFEWFGKAPAHRILTAYGLMEFYDMARVHNVDQAVISRTQNWLISQQEKDGSWKPSEGGIREGAIDKFTDDVLRSTAYITLALASTGIRGEPVQRGAGYLSSHLSEIKDIYTIALVANTFAVLDPEGAAAKGMVQRLLDRAVQEGDVVFWQAESDTPTGGQGSVANIEVTAWAVMALLRTKQSPAVVSKAITYLVKSKDAYGTWQSTQATITALKAMLMAQTLGTQKANASIRVVINGEEAANLSVTAKNADVLQLVDLAQQTRTGENRVRLEFAGEGSLFYSIVGRHWMPHAAIKPSVHIEEPLSIDVAFDKTKLVENDVVTETVTVRNNAPAKAKMVIVDVGIPPGFSPVDASISNNVEKGVVEKYSKTGRQIIFYLREIDAGQTVTISYDLVARMPVEVKTPKSVVYKYYDPEERAETKPIDLVVQAAE